MVPILFLTRAATLVLHGFGWHPQSLVETKQMDLVNHTIPMNKSLRLKAPQKPSLSLAPLSVGRRGRSPALHVESESQGRQEGQEMIARASRCTLLNPVCTGSRSRWQMAVKHGYLEPELQPTLERTSSDGTRSESKKSPGPARLRPLAAERSLRRESSDCDCQVLGVFALLAAEAEPAAEAPHVVVAVRLRPLSNSDVSRARMELTPTQLELESTQLDTVVSCVLGVEDTDGMLQLGIVHALVFDDFVKVGKTCFECHDTTVRSALVARLQKYRQGMGTHVKLTRLPVLFVCKSEAHAKLLEHYTHCFMRETWPESVLSLPSDPGTESGQETYKLEWLSTIVDVLHRSSQRSVSQLTAGKSLICQRQQKRYNGRDSLQGPGLPARVKLWMFFSFEHRYNFDHVFDEDTTQEAVFLTLGQPQLAKAFEGYNSTIFAYGQTGSGKTYTMLNVESDRGHIDLGLIPRMSSSLFQRVAEASNLSKTNRFLVQCSFLEIYNEVIYDLLTPRSRAKGKGLEIREQKGLGVYVKDLTEEVVETSDQMNRLIREGFSQRTTTTTSMNERSSRSHCVFTICLHHHDLSDSSRNTISKLNLVDLAGSERNDSEERSQVKEGANINKSLSALSNVINALSSSTGGRRRAFVPYRDSKLTRVLQESLGGNALCTMIATISPAENNLEESWSTLQYAKRAKTIRVVATRNEETKQRQQLEKEVEALRQRSLDEAGPVDELEEKHRAEIEALEAFMRQTWEDKQRLSKEHEEQRERARLEVQKALEQRRGEFRRRLEGLEKLQDISVTLQSFVATGTASELCPGWPDRLVSTLRSATLQSQLRSARLYKEGVVADFRQLLARDADDATAALLLSQADAKLQILAKELHALQSAEADFKGQMCTVSAEIAINLHEARDTRTCDDGEAQVTAEERLALLALVREQLHQHYRSFSEDFLKEVASLSLAKDLSLVNDRCGAADPVHEVEGCGADILPLPLGLAACDVEDNSLSASSNSHFASCARLHRSLCMGGWNASEATKDEFLEVDLSTDGCNQQVLAGVALQGRLPCSGHWQQTHSLLKTALGDHEALRPTTERTFLRPPVRCVIEVATALQSRSGSKTTSKEQEAIDYAAMTKEAKTDFLTRLIQEAARFFKDVMGPGSAREAAPPQGLSSDGQAEGPEPLKLTAQDVLSGRNCGETNRLLQLLAWRCLGEDATGQWTRQFRLQYHEPQKGWLWYAGDEGEHVFEANTDAHAALFVQLPLPVSASKLRICPLAWHRRPALRIEVFVLPSEVRQRAPEIFQGLQAQIQLGKQAVGRFKLRVEANMREDQLAKEQQVHERGALQRQLEEALARAAASEAQLLRLKADNERLQQQLDIRSAELCTAEEARRSAEELGPRLEEELSRLQGISEDLQEELAVVCEQRDLARAHEEELFYVISGKDEELLHAHSALADLAEHMKDRQLEDDAAELLDSEIAGYAQQLQDLTAKVQQLEEENAELRAERDRTNRKREKLVEQKQELQEKLKQSEQARQAARDRVEQILNKREKKRNSGDSKDDRVAEDLLSSLSELGPPEKPKRHLHRSRTVGSIAGGGATAAEALADMKPAEPGPSSMQTPAEAMLPVFGMPVPAEDVSAPNTGRSRRSSHSGKSGRSHRSMHEAKPVVSANEPLPAFGADLLDAGSTHRPASAHSRKSSGHRR
ncbi:KIF13B [Symbiodinium sp. CCMP2592]|nr:KIF13B [Symbiodinium sp. CCMP2592]